MANDPYRVLGLQPGASGAEIKRAYRALAKANHPDSAGEAALPRFLAIQAAYEQLNPGLNRASGRSRAASTPTASSPTGHGGPRSRKTAGPTDGARSGTGSSSRRGPGTESHHGAGRGSAGPSDRDAGSGATGGRRRTTKKATFGSTTYDEVRDPDDPSWQGAAWYGQSSGEYWTVNPREYADPRKHGPEYQARAADRAARASASEDARTGPRPPSATGTAGEATQDGAPVGDSRRPPRARARPGSGERPDAAADARARSAESRTGRGGRPNSVHRAAPDDDDVSIAASIAALIPSVDWTRLDRGPYRRLIAALVAWPPIGIVLAAAIGGATGCADFAASCTRDAALVPWLAQLVVILVLLALPMIARACIGGTFGVAVLAFPAVAVLAAGGATYDRTYGPASLVAILTIGWLVGVTLMILRMARRPAAA